MTNCVACGWDVEESCEYDFIACGNCGLGQLPPAVRTKKATQAMNEWINTPGGHAPDIAEELDHKARVAAMILTGYNAVNGRGDITEGPVGACLEIGAGNGAISAELRKRGWGTTAIDASKTSCDQMVKKGLIPCFGRFDGFIDHQILNAWKDRFDLIIAWDSIEHMEDVNLALDRAIECLKKGGVFVMHSPDFSKYRGNPHHPHYKDPSHLWHLTTSAVKHMLNGGVDVTRVELGTLWGDPGYAHKDNFVLWAVKL